ncbi:MAG TPA: hypothetical protein VFA68_14830 [Terriglobales bacterium]|nr:hypothetical protein [Terriglobales bacterium]
MAIRLSLLAVVFGLVSCAVAQSQTPFNVDNNFVHKQFGADCSLLASQLPMVADLNSDGVDDIVMPANCTKPLVNAAENGYRVIDPYNSFFGYGNPKVTTEFASGTPELRGYALLVIHGAGPEAWHSDSPKAKFLIINLPYKEFSVKKVGFKKKKKATMAIYVEEAGGDQMTSVVSWDGRKYKYSPLGSSLE